MPRIFIFFFIKNCGVLGASEYFTSVAEIKGNIFLKCLICYSAAVISLTSTVSELGSCQVHSE